MTIRHININGLPPEIEVRRSTRRRRTVGAHRESGKTIVVIPERMSEREARIHAIDLHQRLLRRTTRRRPSDTQLSARAEALRQQYLPEAPQAASVGWSTQQMRRWGSCTPTDRAIRLSARLRDMPAYVIDYVLIHELAHLIEHNHSAAFRALVARFPDSARGSAFLDGVDFASSSH